MPNLSIKDVPQAWAEALRQRASRSHRSLQGELMAIIERALREPDPGLPASAGAGSPAGVRNGVINFDRLGHPMGRRGSKTIEQIHAEHLQRFPKPFTEGPMSVDIIRQDRDRR